MRARVTVPLCLCIGLAAFILGQSREKSGSATGSARYRVTNWPDHTGADKSYVDEVESHLNKMAAEGWRYQGDLVGQTVKMMVFEREK